MDTSFYNTHSSDPFRNAAPPWPTNAARSGGPMRDAAVVYVFLLVIIIIIIVIIVILNFCFCYLTDSYQSPLLRSFDVGT